MALHRPVPVHLDGRELRLGVDQRADRSLRGRCGNENIDRAELDRRAECLRMWQEQNCSWDVIATRLGRALAIEMGPNTA